MSGLPQFAAIKKCTSLTSHIQGKQHLWGVFSCCEACLEDLFNSFPRTPTVSICSPEPLSSSTAASCVVTTLCFIHSSAPVEVHPRCSSFLPAPPVACRPFLLVKLSMCWIVTARRVVKATGSRRENQTSHSL